jgi:hypothetical protein
MTKYNVGDRVVVGDKLRQFPLLTFGTIVGFEEVITFDIHNVNAVVELEKDQSTVTIHEDWLDPIPARFLK